MNYLRGGATLHFDSEKCSGCGRCVEVCPHQVFEVKPKSKAFIIDRDSCIECGACAKNCQPGAIQVHSGVGCAAALFYSMRTGKQPCC